MFYRSLLSLVVPLGLALVSYVAHADTITQTFSTGPLSIGGPTNLYFDVARFDPALGSLTSVGGSLSGSFSVYNPAGYGLMWHTLGFNPGEPIVYGRNYVDTVTGSYTVNDSNTITDAPTLADVTGTGTASPRLLLNLTPEFFITSSGLTVTIRYNYAPAGPQPAITPEPSTLVLLASGCVSLTMLLRRRVKV